MTATQFGESLQELLQSLYSLRCDAEEIEETELAKLAAKIVLEDKLERPAFLMSCETVGEWNNRHGKLTKKRQRKLQSLADGDSASLSKLDLIARSLVRMAWERAEAVCHGSGLR